MDECTTVVVDDATVMADADTVVLECRDVPRKGTGRSSWFWRQRALEEEEEDEEILLMV